MTGDEYRSAFDHPAGRVKHAVEYDKKAVAVFRDGFLRFIPHSVMHHKLL